MNFHTISKRLSKLSLELMTKLPHYYHYYSGISYRENSSAIYIKCSHTDDSVGNLAKVSEFLHRKHQIATIGHPNKQKKKHEIKKI